MPCASQFIKASPYKFGNDPPPSASRLFPPFDYRLSKIQLGLCNIPDSSGHNLRRLFSPQIKEFNDAPPIIVVTVAGTPNGPVGSSCSDATASYSVLYGARSIFNESGIIPKELIPSRGTAALFAIQRSLTTTWKMLSSDANPANRQSLVIASSSAYAVHALTLCADLWAAGNYRNEKGELIPNREIIHDISFIVSRLLWEKGIDVFFWLVREMENVEAAGMAEKALGSGRREVWERRFSVCEECRVELGFTSCGVEEPEGNCGSCGKPCS